MLLASASDDTSVLLRPQLCLLTTFRVVIEGWGRQCRPISEYSQPKQPQALDTTAQTLTLHLTDEKSLLPSRKAFPRVPVQDFKEAARLSTEAKALAADAASATEGAAALAAELAGLCQQEALQREEVALLEEALLEARRSAALAQWRRLQARTSLLRGLPSPPDRE